MTVKAVGYPIGLTIDTETGIISGRPLPEFFVADLTGLTLDHTFAEVPTWSPTTLTLQYLGYGLVYPGYHQWEYRVDNGTDVRACILTFNPTTGDTSLQALTKPSLVATAAWYSWSRNALDPWGDYTTPFTTSTVLGPGSVAPATVSAALVPAEATSSIPITISATNVHGSDSKSLVVAATPPALLYRYWRIEITGPSIGGAFGGLVLNEIEGYESADGSGQNVFGASVGSTCTSTGGYLGTPGYTGDGAASVAIDGNTADSASSTYTAIGTVIGQYFQIDCLVPRDIKLSKIFHTTGTQQVGVKLRASQDGIAWVDKSAEVNVGASGRPTLLPAL